MDREAWRATVHGATKSWTRLNDWTELNWHSDCSVENEDSGIYKLVPPLRRENLSDNRWHYCFSWMHWRAKTAKQSIPGSTTLLRWDTGHTSYFPFGGQAERNPCKCSQCLKAWVWTSMSPWATWKPRIHGGAYICWKPPQGDYERNWGRAGT